LRSEKKSMMDGIQSLVVVNSLACVSVFAAIAAMRHADRRRQHEEPRPKTNLDKLAQFSGIQDAVQKELEHRLAVRNGFIMMLSALGKSDSRGKSDLNSVTTSADPATLESPTKAGPLLSGGRDSLTPSSLLDVMTHAHNLRTDVMPIVRRRGVVDSGIKVYTVGDLEGQVHLLYNLLLELNLIESIGESTLTKDNGCQQQQAPACRWTGPPGVYFVQCGDQVDASRLGGERLNLDLDMLLFTDYMQEISDGHFVNIIGNHEWMNVVGDQRYVDGTSSKMVPLPRRKQLFQPKEVLGKILRRRHLVFRINDALFSHGGVCQELLDGVVDSKAALDAFIDRVNALVDDDSNFRSVNDFSAEFKKLAGWDAQGPGVLWTRRYDPKDFKEARVIPEAISKDVRIMVTGHNKIDAMMHVIQELTPTPTPGASTPTPGASTPTPARTHMSICGKIPANRSCKSSTPTDPFKLDLPEDSGTLLMTDTVRSDRAERDIGLQYGILETSESPRFQTLTIQNFACRDSICQLFDTAAFFREYKTCRRATK